MLEDQDIQPFFNFNKSLNIKASSYWKALYLAWKKHSFISYEGITNSGKLVGSFNPGSATGSGQYSRNDAIYGSSSENCCGHFQRCGHFPPSAANI